MIKPIGNQILVKPLEKSNVSEGGIIVPDSAKEVSNKVIIVAVGGGTKKRPMHLREGDVGFRVKSWGTEVEENGEKYYIMDMNAILALN